MKIKEANKEHKPLPPLPLHERAMVKHIQELLDQGVSYRALGRAFGVTKNYLKQVQRFNTGRFYFESKENNAKSNKVLRAERADPLTAKLSSPKGAPKFGQAAQAWDWLEGQRLMEAWMADQMAFQEKVQPPLDPTPAGV